MTQTIDIVVPDLGDFENVEVIEVLATAGDSVEKEDGLITVETDKASMDIPAPENGVVSALTVSVGDTIASGDVIGTMKPQVGDTVLITPAIDAADIAADEASAEVEADAPVEPAAAKPDRQTNAGST